MKRLTLTTKSKAWAGAIALVCVGVLTAVSLSSQPIEPEVPKKSEPVERVSPSKIVPSGTTKNEDVADKTFKKYKLPPVSSIGVNRLDQLTPLELRTVAQVETEKRLAKKTVSTATQVSPLVRPMTPSQPIDLQPPVTPIVPGTEIPGSGGGVITPPLIIESTPVIYFDKGILTLKGEAFNPYEYIRVDDSQDDGVVYYADMSTVDTTRVGSYSFRVIATNKFGRTAVANVPVTVASKPSILVTGTSIDVTIGHSFSALDHVTAVDETEGDLTKKVRVIASNVASTVEGVYSVTYQVETRLGVITTKKVPVYVINKAPVLTFPHGTHEINQAFDPLEGVTAQAYNGDVVELTAASVIENTVDSDTEGTYKVSYQVNDRFGKSSGIIEREVMIENEAPVIHGAVDVTYLSGEPILLEELMLGVTASDREDDKQGKIVSVSVNQESFDSIDWQTPGSYQLTYEVTDSHGKLTTKGITLTLEIDHSSEEEEEQEEQEVSPMPQTDEGIKDDLVGVLKSGIEQEKDKVSDEPQLIKALLEPLEVMTEEDVTDGEE